MATIKLSGEVRWAKVQRPDSKFNYYGVELRPDAKSAGVLLASGITTLKPSKDGEGFYNFKRYPDKPVWENGNQRPAGPVSVFDVDGRETTVDIGNGSTVEIVIDVFPYNNTYGKGVSSRLESVKIIDLVVFERSDNQEGASAPKLKIMF